MAVKNFVGKLPGLDLRGDGGLVVSPPSFNEAGIAYEWLVRLEDVPLADIPDWLSAHINFVNLESPSEKAPALGFGPADLKGSATTSYGRASLERECEILRSAPRGSRNAMLNIAACRLGNLIAGGQLTQQEAFDALIEACTKNGLLSDDGRQQVAATIGSGFKAGFRSPRVPGPILDENNQAEHQTIWLDRVINDDEIPRQAINGMRREFPKHDHNPSEKFWNGLHQITKAIEGMACRLHEHPDIEQLCPGWSSSFFVSFLPCGMGKTTALIETVKAILRMPRYNHVSFVIFLSRLEEIKAVVGRMGLDVQEFAVITSDNAFNGMGNPNKKAARVLFTTQQMLEN